jgi:uncharacterized delta-60 repeat protein
MTLITRQGKGSKISTQEMDNNMDYLEQNSIINITGITSQIEPFDEDKITYINEINLTEDKKQYKGILSDEYETPSSKINIRYNDSVNNQLSVNVESGYSYYLNGNLTFSDGYNESFSASFNSYLEKNPFYDPNGVPFNIGTGFNDIVWSITIQSDGKILVGGNFTSYNGTSRNRIIRLNSDGSIDNTFNIGTGFNDNVREIVIQSDGKILLSGDFTSYNGTSRNRIIRLNSDGSIDNTFSIGTGFNNSVRTITTQSDGKILVGGSFTSYNGTSRNRIIRLNPDGSIDNTFNIGTGFNESVQPIQIQSDGKILIGGYFTSYNGTSRNYIIRLNPDGSIDNTFNIGTLFNDFVTQIRVQSDGKILFGGNFTSYNGTSRNRIIRLNSDGSIDNTFNIGTGFNDTVHTIQIQTDGKILVSGGFTTYNGTTRNRIIRLNSNGSIDNTFNVGTGFNNIGFSIQILSDEKILIGGWFTSYNETTRNRIVKLNPNGIIDLNQLFFTSINYTFNPFNLNINLDVNSEDELILTTNFEMEKSVLDFNLIEIKN